MFQNINLQLSTSLWTTIVNFPTSLQLLLFMYSVLHAAHLLVCPSLTVTTDVLKSVFGRLVAVWSFSFMPQGAAQVSLGGILRYQTWLLGLHFFWHLIENHLWEYLEVFILKCIHWKSCLMNFIELWYDDQVRSCNVVTLTTFVSVSMACSITQV